MERKEDKWLKGSPIAIIISVLACNQKFKTMEVDIHKRNQHQAAQDYILAEFGILQG